MRSSWFLVRISGTSPPRGFGARVSHPQFRSMWAGLLMLSVRFSSNPNPRLCLPTPPSTSTCTLAIFSIPLRTRSPVSRRAEPNRTEPVQPSYGTNKCDQEAASALRGDLSALAASADPSRRHEHLQTDRGPVSSGCHHHPAAQSMEEQVLCRWAWASSSVTRDAPLFSWCFWVTLPFLALSPPPTSTLQGS